MSGTPHDDAPVIEKLNQGLEDFLPSFRDAKPKFYPVIGGSLRSDSEYPASG